MPEQRIDAMTAFPTLIYSVEKPEFVEQVRTVSLDMLKDAQPANALHPVRMSGPMEMDPRLQEFARFTAIAAGNILTDQGYLTNRVNLSYAGYSATVYTKGAWFMQFLEERYGREKFDPFLRGYFDHGMHEVCLIDPADQTVELWNTPWQPLQLTDDDAISSPLLPGFSLPLPDLFA